MAIAPLPELEVSFESPWPRPDLQLVEYPGGDRAGEPRCEREPSAAGTRTSVAGAPRSAGPKVSGAARRAVVHRRAVSARTRRRRLAFAVGAAAVVAALALPISALGGRPAVSPASPSSAAVVPGSTVYVVQPGDTLWSIATAFDHGGDPRPLAEAIAKETGSAVVVPGERLRIP